MFHMTPAISHLPVHGYAIPSKNLIVLHNCVVNNISRKLYINMFMVYSCHTQATFMLVNASPVTVYCKCTFAFHVWNSINCAIPTSNQGIAKHASKYISLINVAVWRCKIIHGTAITVVDTAQCNFLGYCSAKHCYMHDAHRKMNQFVISLRNMYNFWLHIPCITNIT